MSKDVVKKFEEIVATTSPRVRFRINNHGLENGDFYLFLWKVATRREEAVFLRDDDKVTLCRLAERLAEMLGKDLRNVSLDRGYELTYNLLTPKK
jgi:hypothetical protein